MPLPMRTAPDHDDDSPDERPSKSALKRQMHDLQDLGQALLDLPISRSERLDLPEGLRDAMAEFRRTRSHEGKRRQLQYIGKLMRKVDPDPIREAVAAFQLGQAQDALTLHQAERWRDELLADDQALTRWMNAHPETEPQVLRNLVRAARKDRAAQAERPGEAVRQGRAYRDLFQLVRQGLAGAEGSRDDNDDPDPLHEHDAHA